MKYDTAVTLRETAGKLRFYQGDMPGTAEAHDLQQAILILERISEADDHNVYTLASVRGIVEELQRTIHSLLIDLPACSTIKVEDCSYGTLNFYTERLRTILQLAGKANDLYDDVLERENPGERDLLSGDDDE